MSMSEDTPLVPETPEDVAKNIVGEGNQSVEDTTQVTTPKGLTLEQINTSTGKDYKTLEDAVKGIQNLSSFVGQREEKVVKNLTQKGEFITKDQYNQDMFYSKNPELVPYKDIIDSRASVLKVSVQDAVEKDPILKDTLSKLHGYDDTENAKSVLMSNPRLGQITDKLQVAHDALAKGDHQAAEKSAVDAVMDIAGK